MKSTEAKEYFHTFGDVYREIRTQSPQEVGIFLVEERRTKEYGSALTALKLNHDEHFKRGAKNDIALTKSIFEAQHSAINNGIGWESDSKIRRWITLCTANEDLVTFIGGFQDSSQRITTEDQSKNSKHALMIFLFAARQQMKSLIKQQVGILGTDGLADNVKRALEIREFSDIGSLDIKAYGVSLGDFSRENFRTTKQSDNQRVIQYLRFFMTLGTNPGDDIEEDIQEQNWNQISGEYPFLHRNTIRETARIARAFYVFPVIEPRKFQNGFYTFPQSFRETIKGVTQAAVDSQQQFFKFNDRVHQLVFNPKLEGSDVMRKACMNYLISDSNFHSQFLLGLMGITTPSSLTAGYRQCIDLIEEGSDVGFYQVLAVKMMELVENHKNLALLTIDDLDAVITPRQTSEKPEEAFTNLTNTIQKLNKTPKWKDADISEIEIPWEDAGVKKPHTVSVRFSNGDPMNFDFELGYQNQYGESLNISLIINLRKKDFDWSILQASQRYPDLQVRFMGVINAIFGEIFSRLNPYEETKKSTKVASTTTTSKVKPARPVNFVGPAKSKTATKSEVQTPLKLFELEDSKEDQIKDCILVTEDNSITPLFEKIPNDQRRMILRRITEFNSVGRGKFKRLEHAGPNGERQYSLRMGNYRILLLEQQFSHGTRTYRIRNIGHRNEIYDEVDN